MANSGHRSAIPLNQSVEKALAVLRAFGGTQRALTLGEIAKVAGITKSSAQRVAHTLQHLGYVQRDAHANRWVLSPRVLTSRSASQFCTAAGRAYLSRLPMDEVSNILDRSPLRAFTPHTLTDRELILALIRKAHETGYAHANQECYRGDLTIGAAIMGPHGGPVAAINISGPSSRWTQEELEQRWSPLLIQTARAASSGMADRIALTGAV